MYTATCISKDKSQNDKNTPILIPFILNSETRQCSIEGYCMW